MMRKFVLIGIILFASLAATACVTHVVHHPATYPPPPAAPPPPGYSPPGMSAEVEMFYDDLVLYGDWVMVDGPGWVWHPRSVSASWRPYTMGRWAYTDFGWTWVSDEQWGWATYHYGRWHHTSRYGWVWVPGAEWGPAWVTWNSGGGWVGWAPLPWRVAWRAGVGLDWGNVNVYVALDPAWWCFLPTGHLADSKPRLHFASHSRNASLIKSTTNITNYTIVDNRIFNRGVHVDVVDRAAGHRVPRYRVRHDDSPRAALDRRGNRVEGDELVVFRPGRRRGQRSPEPTANPSKKTGTTPKPTGSISPSSRRPPSTRSPFEPLHPKKGAHDAVPPQATKTGQEEHGRPSVAPDPVVDEKSNPKAKRTSAKKKRGKSRDEDVKAESDEAESDDDESADESESDTVSDSKSNSKKSRNKRPKR